MGPVRDLSGLQPHRNSRMDKGREFLVRIRCRAMGNCQGSDPSPLPGGKIQPGKDPVALPRAGQDLQGHRIPLQGVEFLPRGICCPILEKCGILGLFSWILGDASMIRTAPFPAFPSFPDESPGFCAGLVLPAVHGAGRGLGMDSGMSPNLPAWKILFFFFFFELSQSCGIPAFSSGLGGNCFS